MACSSLSGLLVLLSVLSVLVPACLSQPSFPFTAKSTSGFPGRQHGGLLVVGNVSSVTTIALSSGSTAVTASALLLYGGHNGAAGINDVWYSSNGGQQLASVAITAAYVAQSYGPATCVDSARQILYSLGGDASGGSTAGTSQLYYSTTLGQSWSLVTAPWPGRSNALCLVDSASRLYVIGGKLANSSGVAVSNDVWAAATSLSGSTVTFAWTQQSAAAPFSARDGPGGATYYSAGVGADVLYVAGGYTYNSQEAQYGNSNQDNGVGDNVVWASIDAGRTWTSLGAAQWAARYHNKVVATKDGVLASYGGAVDPPPTNGGDRQIGDLYQNDLYVSLDGGYVWGLCNGVVLPAYQNTSSSVYTRGGGRQDVLMQVDPNTGFLYIGSGLQYNAAGNAQQYVGDLFVSTISLFNINAVASACGLSLPYGGSGLVSAPILSLVALTAAGPFLPRQQGGLLVVNKTGVSLTTAAGAVSTVQSSLVVFGGQYPGGSVSQSNDVFYSTSGQSWSSVTVSGVFTSQSYGPATCVDNNQQVLYSVGGDTVGGDTGGTAAVWFSVNLGQSWTSVTGAFPGRANAVCFVDSFSRLVVVAGKWANNSGVAVSNDVWVGTPSSVPPTATSTFTWSQASASAPFSARDGPSGASYYSAALGIDVYYVSGGYSYESSVAQFSGDNGVGNSDVWASVDQGRTWKLIASNQFPPRYHGKMLATRDGVLVVVVGANAPPTYKGGTSQGSSYLRNDMWASLDGGYTWGQCATQLFPLAGGFNASQSNSFARGTGREDPVLAIDPATGYLYMGQGLQRNQAGSAQYPKDLYRTSISFYDIGQVAALCGNLAIPVGGFGMQSLSLSQVGLVTLTSNGPFLPRQQGGLYVVDSYSADVYTNVVTSTGTQTAQQSALVVFGGQYPGGSVSQSNDVFYSTSGQSWSSVTVSGVFTSQSYGPATCVDNNQQVLYSVGGDTVGGDTGGTAAVWFSVNLGQSWTSVTGAFPGRANAVCFVDSFSRLVVVAGKWANNSGVAVSNDVWVGTPSSVPPTATSTFTWSQASASAPFSARDGPSGASYYSAALGIDVYYVSGGYSYESSVAQFSGDNGVGNSDVWASVDQGRTWKLIASNQFPPRYHGKMLATRDGVLVVVVGANAPPTYKGGTSQGSSYLRNDMWASLDGGYTWGQCATQLFPLAGGFNASQSNSFARGTGREDPVLAIDPATGYLYMGQGLQRNQAGSAQYPKDLYRTSISFYDIGQVAALCGNLAIPGGQIGMQQSSLTGVLATQLTSAAPFLPRQQGGIYVVNSFSADTFTSLTTASGSFPAALDGLVVFGGRNPVNSGQSNDVWYSSTGGSQWTQVTITTSGGYTSETYGPATCVDNDQQVLYSVGGDTSGGATAGTNAIWYSLNLGQTWLTVAGGFPGRANSVCFVDSYSRLVVIAGKVDNTAGNAVSNDVWVGTPSAVPLTATSTFSWVQASAAAPFSPRDGPLAATYYSSTLGIDVYYAAGGYTYENSVAQGMDNGVGSSEVWASVDQGKTWKLISVNQLPPRYHGRLLATKDGVLVVLAGANAPPTTNGGASQGSEYVLNDMWASLDGGYTWGQCSSQVFPNASGTAGLNGRQDPLLAIDPTTGYLFFGAGLGANNQAPTDLFRSSVSFYDIGQVAGLCALALPGTGPGLQQLSLTGVLATQLTSAAPFLPRQQGGIYVVNSFSADTFTSLTTASGSFPAALDGLVVFGGRNPVNSGQSNDVWYSSTGGSQWTQVTITTSGGYTSETYGPATCVDNDQQVLYSVGGDTSGGATAGTNAIWYSLNLGQTWLTVAGGFPGRANSVCFVDSYSRLVVIAGKVDNTAGNAVSNDVWVGTPSAVPLTATSTFSWVQASAAAPFSPRDGPLAATYYSSTLGIDVYYAAGGYTYENSVAQGMDNGVGSSEVWASVDQGKTWKLISVNQLPPRYHGRLLATKDGVLVVLAGANAPPTTNGGASQGSEYVLNDMWASLDGGYTWGQCSSQVFPNASGTAGLNGRQDPLLAIDPTTGYLFFGAGLGANNQAPTDLFRSSVSFYDIGQVAGLCGNLRMSSAGTGLLAPPVSVNGTSRSSSSTGAAAGSSSASPAATSSSSGGASGGGVSNSGGGSSGLSGGAIAGIVIGSVVGAAILLALCVALCLRRNNSKRGDTAVETSRVGMDSNRPHAALPEHSSTGNHQDGTGAGVELAEVA